MRETTTTDAKTHRLEPLDAVERQENTTVEWRDAGKAHSHMLDGIRTLRCGAKPMSAEKSWPPGMKGVGDLRSPYRHAIPDRPSAVRVTKAGRS